MVEGTGLENRQARKRLEGSNPSPSATYQYNSMISLLLVKIVTSSHQSNPHFFALSVGFGAA